MELPLVGYGIRDRSLRASPQTTINLYAMAHPGKSGSFSYQHTPGLKLFKDLGSSPCRMIHVMNERLYAIAGTKLYEINDDGTETERADIPGTQIPKVDNNGFQLIIPLGQNAYVYNANTEALTTLQNGSGDYYASSACAVVGRRVAYIRDNTSQFFLSDIDDAAAFTAANFANAESRPDDNISTHQFKGHLWLFGARSFEGWYLSNESFPLNPFPNAKFNIGCGALNSVASDELRMAWLSHNRRIYLYDGGTPAPISNADLEYELSQMGSVGDAVAYFYTEEEHTFYVIQFPTAGRTFHLDITTGEWAERQSNQGRHLALQYAYVYGKHFVCSYLDGKIYEMDLDCYTDGGSSRHFQFTMPAVQNPGASTTISRIEWVLDGGLSPYLDNTDVEVRWTDNGHDWSDWVPISGGNRAQYSQKFKLTGLGTFEERFFQVRTTSSGPIRFLRAFMEADSGQRP